MTDEKLAYSAPALEKGLDILELLAAAGRPMATRHIAEELGRSKNEIFRMVHVLLGRGYLQRDDGGEGFVLSNKLFGLGMQTARARALVTAAAPIVEAFAEEVRQAAHLVVAHRGETVVIAAVCDDEMGGLAHLLGEGLDDRRRCGDEGAGAGGLHPEAEELVGEHQPLAAVVALQVAAAEQHMDLSLIHI